MAKLFQSGQRFETEGREGMQEFSMIPDDWYIAEIIESETKANAKKNGHFTSLAFSICEGKYAKRRIYVNLNLDNQSEQAVEIAESELTSICQACRVHGVEDSEELHNIPLRIKIGRKKASGGYPESNKIVSYEPLKGGDRPPKLSDDSADESVPARKRPKVEFD